MAQFVRTMNDYVLTPDLRIIRVLTGLADYYGRTWCKPNYKKIQELLQRFTGRILSTRALARHLGALERDGWLTRQRRHTKGRNGEIECHSTLYRIARRSRDALSALNAGWRQFLTPAERKPHLFAVTKQADTVVPPSLMVVNQHGDLRSLDTKERLRAVMDALRRKTREQQTRR